MDRYRLGAGGRHRSNWSEVESDSDDRQRKCSAAMGKQQAGQWQPIVPHAAIPLQNSRPLASVGELFPPKPEARSKDLGTILPSYPLYPQQPAPPMEQPPPGEPEPEKETPQAEPRKLIASIPEAVLAMLRSTCAAKAEVALLGRVQGKHPGLKALTAWARDMLHPSLSLLSLKTNNLFEVTLSQPEGRIHALTRADLVCDTASIFFSSWSPHFDSTAPQAEESLDHPVWVQIVDLCQVLREEFFLRIIGEQIGHVISIDNSDAYRAKLFGPRIRLLVRDLHQLPQTVVIPRLDGEGTVEYQLEFSGLPKQCGRCRAHDHLVKNCPRKTLPVRKKDGQAKHKGSELGTDQHMRTESVPTQQDKKDTTRLPSKDDNSLVDSSSKFKDLSGTQEQTHEARTSPQKLHSPSKADVAPERTTSPSKVVDVAPARSTSPNIADCTHKAGTQDIASLSQAEANPLQPDDINFPKLQTPVSASRKTPVPQTSDTHIKNQEPKFVWQSTYIATPIHKSSEGGKGKDKLPDSTPLTRQGYRSGRLAEDFWTALGMPNTPATNPKMLRVIPFLTKNRQTEQSEYLVDTRGHSFGAIAHVHVAEVLAGIPWTQNRARQHVVNEVSQALYKLIVFNNNLSNPFQKWAQGRWYAQWRQGPDGENICTLFVSIDALEQKVKPRKGLHLSWRKEPPEISTLLAERAKDDIQMVDPDFPHWKKMAGRLPGKSNEQAPPESHNRFASLLENEVALEL